MKKIALALVLAAVSGAAMAEWVALGSTQDSTDYADANTVRRLGNMVKMWSLSDYKTGRTLGTGEPYLSTKSQPEFDCIKERFRIQFSSFHSEKMGGGTVIYTINNPAASWIPIPPASLAESFWKFACGKQ